mmetsp:Transcript_908/g.1726  ORF Transcript_908/g.1726 Transcript_908/m.1726 type:complete len:327 (+) Transcript_908:1106-2086(+)
MTSPHAIEDDAGGSREMCLDAAALGRTAAVVRHRGHVTNGRDLKTQGSQGTQRAFTARAGTLHFDFQRANAVVLCFLARVFCSHLGSKRRGLAGALETHGASRRPCNGVALNIRDKDFGVVERRVHMSNASGDVLGDLLLCGATIASHAISPPLFLLAGNGLCRAFARASVGVGALTANGQVATVTQATVGTEVHQTFDVHLGLTTQVTFDGVVGVDVLTDGENLGVGQLVDATCGVDADCFADRGSRGVANSGDIGQRDRNALGGGDVNPGNTCHVWHILFVASPSCQALFSQRKPGLCAPGLRGNISGSNAHLIPVKVRDVCLI